MNLVYITCAIAIVSLATNIGLIIWMTRLSSHYNALTKDTDKKSLMGALEGIQKTLATHERNLVISKKEQAQIVDDARHHIQQVTLKRFNPFSDTGGDQSFILALLDGNKDGVVITSLHSRENTRFYIKTVKEGQGLDHPLSKEEQKIIK